MLPKPECRSFLIRRILKKINKDKTKSLLDIGFGKGELLNILDEDYIIIGVDNSKQACNYVKEKYPWLNIFNEDYSTQKEEYDIVLCISILEHIKNDFKTLKDWRNLIKENGYLLLAVPSNPSLFDYWDEFYGHYRRYSKKGLIKLLEKAGYKIIYFYSYGYPIINWADFYKRRKIKKKQMKKNFKERIDASGFMERGNKITNLFINKLTLFPFLYLQFLFLNKDKSTGYLVLCKKI